MSSFIQNFFIWIASYKTHVWCDTIFVKNIQIKHPCVTFGSRGYSKKTSLSHQTLHFCRKFSMPTKDPEWLTRWRAIFPYIPLPNFLCWGQYLKVVILITASPTLFLQPMWWEVLKLTWGVEAERTGMRSTLESCPDVAAFFGSLTLGHQVPHLWKNWHLCPALEGHFLQHFDFKTTIIWSCNNTATYKVQEAMESFAFPDKIENWWIFFWPLKILQKCSKLNVFHWKYQEKTLFYCDSEGNASIQKSSM